MGVLINLQSVLSQIVSTFFSQIPKRIYVDQIANQNLLKEFDKKLAQW